MSWPSVIGSASSLTTSQPSSAERVSFSVRPGRLRPATYSEYQIERRDAGLGQCSGVTPSTDSLLVHGSAYAVVIETMSAATATAMEIAEAQTAQSWRSRSCQSPASTASSSGKLTQFA